MPFLSPSAFANDLAEHDAGVLDRVMKIDLHVALGAHFEIEERVLGEKRQHVIEERNARRDRRLAAAIDGELDRDIGLAGDAVNLGVACSCSSNLFLLLLVEADGHRTRVGVELLHRAERLDVRAARGAARAADIPRCWCGGKTGRWSGRKTPWPRRRWAARGSARR